MPSQIAAVLNLHREGYLCKPTIESLKRSIDFAEARGVTTEVIVVFDKSDSDTQHVAAAEANPSWHLKEAALGDLGASRNLAVSQCTADLVAFLDGDDLWGENWLFSCVEAARKATRKNIWHPEVSIYFGARQMIFHHLDMESPHFDLIDLAFENMWTALACTHRDVLLENPYPLTDLRKKVGYEDWGWNLKTIEKGYHHRTISGTGHAVRVKDGGHSLLNQTNNSGAVPCPSRAFRSLLTQPVSKREGFAHLKTAQGRRGKGIEV